MAKGNFRTGNNICVCCGYMYSDNSAMPYKIGKGANKIYLCEKCFSSAEKVEKFSVVNGVNFHPSLLDY